TNSSRCPTRASPSRYITPHRRDFPAGPGTAEGSGGAAASASPPWRAPRGLLAVLPPLPPLLAGLKTRTVLKRRCKDCYIVRRRGRVYVCCRSNPRHKQRKG
uniref:Ribosomal protein n=1 Tax=Catharus ustulatus TaxID=91951 RepID=A0A8C3US92_CATUS